MLLQVFRLSHLKLTVGVVIIGFSVIVVILVPIVFVQESHVTDLMASQKLDHDPPVRQK
jgi:hypothetical protein